MLESTTTNRFELKFNTAIGAVARFTIPHARTNKTADNAAASMQALIDNGAIRIGANGAPNGIHGAQIITTTRQPL